MTTAAPTTALVMIQYAFTDAERLALAGYLAGYRGLTREAYALVRPGEFEGRYVCELFVSLPVPRAR
jgi:hypothetical protein